METRLRTSFVPKKTLALSNPAGGRGPSIHILLAIATIIFFFGLSAAAGVYFYKVILQKRIEEKGLALEKAKKAFELSLIIDVKRLDLRIQTAQQILASHVAVTPVFRLLENETLRTVRFNSFDFKNEDKANPHINMKGEAQGYEAVALQSDELAKNKYIRNPVFSGLNLNKQGGVQFLFTAALDPEMFYYKKNFEAEAAEAESGSEEEEAFLPPSS